MLQAKHFKGKYETSQIKINNNSHFSKGVGNSNQDTVYGGGGSMSVYFCRSKQDNFTVCVTCILKTTVNNEPFAF